jgi:hypothetical protein
MEEQEVVMMISNTMIKYDDVECSACGKKVPMRCMFMSAAIKPGYMTDHIPSQRVADGMKKSMGVYPTGEYHVCYECAFKAMGISELRKESE